MNLERQDLFSLEEYASKRDRFRSHVIAHKKNRQVLIGDHIALIFENRLTIQYQIQEMLRIEKVFEAEGIDEELNAYNPLIPDGENWKCTLMIQYEDVEERRQRLQELVGIEDKIWVQVDDLDKVYPIADEDMDRTNETKTSAVHFLRYQLSAESIKALLQEGKKGKKAQVRIGVEHEAYPVEPVELSQPVIDSLTKDLNQTD